MLLIGAVVTGAALVVNKEALAHAPFWTVFGLRALGMGPAMAAFAYRPTLLAEVLTTLRNPKARWLYVRGEMVPANAALLLLQLALKLGPVSLVSAVIASRPLFVFFLSVALSTRLWKVLDEPLDRDALALKLAATILIVGGVVVLALTG